MSFYVINVAQHARFLGHLKHFANFAERAACTLITCMYYRDSISFRNEDEDYYT